MLSTYVAYLVRRFRIDAKAQRRRGAKKSISGRKGAQRESGSTPCPVFSLRLCAFASKPFATHRFAAAFCGCRPPPCPCWSLCMWQFLYFLPLPHQQGSLRPSSRPLLRIVWGLASPPPSARFVRMFLAMGVGGGGAACASRRANCTLKTAFTVSLRIASSSSPYIAKASFLYATTGSTWA